MIILAFTTCKASDRIMSFTTSLDVAVMYCNDFASKVLVSNKFCFGILTKTTKAKGASKRGLYLY